VAVARRLADAGRLDEARAACEGRLRADPADADALALLGVVHLAAERPAEAFDALRKALYLAPDHLEALAHMATLYERRGDAPRAAALRARFARLGPPGSEERA
jgi:chemotaxis protein methyltransferase WspC